LIADRAIKKYPDEVVGYLTIDPNFVTDVRAEARKWRSKTG